MLRVPIRMAWVTIYLFIEKKYNKTCHRDRTARLTAPCPSHKNFNVQLFANANADANAGGSTIALPGLHPGELKNHSKIILKASLNLQICNTVLLDYSQGFSVPKPFQKASSVS